MLYSAARWRLQPSEEEGRKTMQSVQTNQKSSVKQGLRDAINPAALSEQTIWNISFQCECEPGLVFIHLFTIIKI